MPASSRTQASWLLFLTYAWVLTVVLRTFTCEHTEDVLTKNLRLPAMLVGTQDTHLNFSNDVNTTNHFLGSEVIEHISLATRNNQTMLTIFDGFEFTTKTVLRRHSLGQPLDPSDELYMSAVDPIHKLIMISPYKVASSELHILAFRLMG